MTIQQLDTCPPALAPDDVSSEVIEVLHVAIDRVTGLRLEEIADAQVAVLLGELSRAESRVAAGKLALLEEADRRRLAEQAAATGTDAWAARLTGTTRAVMAGGLWLAEALELTYHQTRDAFAAGAISQDQARIIVSAAERLPARIGAAQRRTAERALVAQATDGLDPRRLRIAARRMLQVVSAELADQHEAELLVAEERRAENETWFSLGDNGDGTWAGKFVIPELHGTMLRAALEHLTSPRGLGRDRAGATVVDASVAAAMNEAMSYPERLGAGLCELIEHLPTDGHAPVSATVIIHLDHQHLLDSLSAAGLDTGTTISASQARRLACGAGILPAVYGGRSQPLDLGRERRLHSKAQRLALSSSHDTCAVTGCERPFAWCEIHHPDPWSEARFHRRR